MKTPPVTAALAVVELAQQGRFTQIQEQFAPQLQPMVPAQALQAAWEGELAKHGPVASVGTPVTEPAGPARPWSRSRCVSTGH
ncbi:MAG TPA: hypothetical protein VMK84_16560 [Streptosporangiaceae bacterium]|nr:hypothetical protein [Streptosporangiaceae bacterium]